MGSSTGKMGSSTGIGSGTSGSTTGIGSCGAGGGGIGSGILVPTAGGAPAEYLLHLASAWNASEACDRPDEPRLEFDCRHPGAFVLVGLFGGGFLLLRDANGDFLPFSDLRLNGSGLLFRNGLLLLHVCGLWRFGALLVYRTKEGLAGPGDEQDEQEQGDHDPPNDVDASSGLLACLHRFLPYLPGLSLAWVRWVKSFLATQRRAHSQPLISIMGRQFTERLDR